jgi:hypothetical protein
MTVTGSIVMTLAEGYLVCQCSESLFGCKAKAQVDLGAHRCGIEKRLRRSDI